jgi:hypothetical protein
MSFPTPLAIVITFEKIKLLQEKNKLFQSSRKEKNPGIPQHVF